MPIRLFIGWLVGLGPKFPDELPCNIFSGMSLVFLLIVHQTLFTVSPTVSYDPRLKACYRQFLLDPSADLKKINLAKQKMWLISG